jgi:hypothetical protein
MKDPFFLITTPKCIHAAASLIPVKLFGKEWDKLQWTICGHIKSVRGKKQDSTMTRGSLEDVTCERCKDKLIKMGWL